MFCILIFTHWRKGTKRWVMYPPGWVPPGVTPNGRDDFDAPIPMKWFLQQYYEVRCSCCYCCCCILNYLLLYWILQNPDGNKGGEYCPVLPGAVECQQQAGEIIWVPTGWWHQLSCLLFVIVVCNCEKVN
jgi:hypothetical protein